MKISFRYSNLLFGGLLCAMMVTVFSGTVVLVTQSFMLAFSSSMVEWFCNGVARRFLHAIG